MGLTLTREQIERLKRDDVKDEKAALIETLGRLVDVLSRLEAVLAQLTERVGGNT